MAEVHEVTPRMEISGYAGARAATAGAARAAQGGPAAAEGPPVSIAAQTAQRAEAMNAFLQGVNVSLRFNVDASSNSVMIMIVDSANGEVIRTVPPEYFMKATGAFGRQCFPKGIILDEDV